MSALQIVEQLLRGGDDRARRASGRRRQWSRLAWTSARKRAGSRADDAARDRWSRRERRGQRAEFGDQGVGPGGGLGGP